MVILLSLIFLQSYLVISFRLPISSHTPIFNIKSQSFHDSLYRTPLPDEEIRLPKINQPTGEFLLDKSLIKRVAALRTFIESIEINRGKIPDPNSIYAPEEGVVNKGDEEIKENKIVEINEETLEPIKDLLSEEDLLEEVLSKAFDTYRKDDDFESIDRLNNIAEQIVPIATKFRRRKSELNIGRLISCYMDGKEDLDTVLDELQEKRSLDKYLMTRLDEIINLAAKKYRISDNHPAVSEEFLKILKDRIAAQRITYARGSNLYVKTLALCLQSDDKEIWNQLIKDNIRRIDDLEEFHEWLVDGIDYCKKNNRMEGKVDKMEKILELVIRQHPIWNPKDTHIEYEDTPNYDNKFDPSILDKAEEIIKDR